MSGFDIKLINAAIDRKLEFMYFALPCKILSYNSTLQKVEVEIMIKQKKSFSKEEKKFPPIAEVPVGFYNANDGLAYMSFPLKVGDLGTVFFSTLDIDNYMYLLSNQPVDSDSYARQQLKDAFFVPIVRPWTKPLLNINSNNVEINNALGKLSVTPEGKVSFENVIGIELVDQISKISADISLSLAIINAALSTAAAAGTTLSTATTFAHVKTAGTALATISTQVAALTAQIVDLNANITLLNTLKV